MIILNESAYIAAVLSGDFTNKGMLIPIRNNKYYIPFVRALWNENGNVRRKYAKAIDNCGIDNFSGEGFQFLFNQWKNSWRGKHPDWVGKEGLPILSAQKVSLDAIELYCLFSIQNKRARAKNLIALFLINYLGIQYPKVKFPYSLLCDLCGYKVGDHWDKHRVIRSDMGISAVKRESGYSNQWQYDRGTMEKYHADFLENQCILPIINEFPLYYEGDYIWHSGLPFDNNGLGIIGAFEALRTKIYAGGSRAKNTGVNA